MIEIKWIHCPVCGNKTRTMIRKDTELRVVSSELLHNQYKLTILKQNSNKTKTEAAYTMK